MHPLIWLASFPKSGNTWVRALLANLRSPTAEPLHINKLDAAGPSAVACSRYIFDEIAGIESADLNREEIDTLRPRVWAAYAREVSAACVVKAHDAFLLAGTGQPVVPPATEQRAIYLIRDPRDVVLSWASFNQIPVDRAIAWLQDDGFELDGGADRLSAHLPQFLGSWCQHVRSWTEQDTIDTLVVRYEDLHASPVETLGRMAVHLGWEASSSALADAVAASRFEVLHTQEAAAGFHEHAQGPEPFFRVGTSGGWAQGLTLRQREQIEAFHGDVMGAHSYL